MVFRYHQGTGIECLTKYVTFAIIHKPLSQFGPGVYELRESFDRNAYRMMYVVNLKKAIYVLHAFMKKSKSGIGLPKPDAELIAIRLRRAQELDEMEDRT